MFVKTLSCDYTMTFLTVLRPKTSTLNSTVDPIPNGGSFTGGTENVTDYASTTVFIRSDQPLTLDLQRSTDGVTWYTQETHSITSSQEISFTMEITAEFFRVVCTNNSGSPTDIVLETLLNPYKNSDSAIVGAIEENTSVINNIANPASLDAFARLRVSNPETLTDNNFLTDKNPLRWDEKVSGTGGNIAHTPGYLSLRATPLGGRVVNQRRLYTPYQPGKSLLILATGTLLVDTTNIGDTISRIGYFDDENDKTAETGTVYGCGYFFEYDYDATTSTGTLSVVERTCYDNLGVIIPQSDNKIPQSNWNIDPMDGSGPSGITIDPTKRQIFLIEMEWLGVGTVQLGIVVDRQVFYVHRFDHANLVDAYPYIPRASLPIRYEIEQSTSGITDAQMIQVCSTVISEGGYLPTGLNFALANTQQVTVSDGPGVDTVLIALRLRSDRARVTVRITNFSFTEDSGGTLLYKLWRIVPLNQIDLETDPDGNGAAIINSTTPPGIPLNSWTQYNPGTSAVEYGDVTSGTKYYINLSKTDALFEVLSTGYLTTAQRAITPNFTEIFSAVLTSDIAGNSDYIVLTLSDLSGNPSCYASIEWQEVE